MICVLPLGLYGQDVLPSLEAEAERQLLREQQRSDERNKQTPVDVRLKTESIGAADDAIPTNESPCFTINNIQIVGQYAQPFSWLTQSIFSHKDTSSNKILGRCIGAKGINIIMGRMQNALVKKGYVTSRIVVSEQDLTSTTLKLTLVAGRIHTIRFSDERPRANILPMQTGDLLNLRDIEQALESMRRLPSVDTDIKILPASDKQAKPGDSDLLIVWKQKKPLRLVASIDNTGIKSTGLYQGNLSLAYDNLLGLHDILNLSIGHDIGGAEQLKGGTESYSLSYTLPIKYWDLSLQLSESDYLQTVQGAFQNFQFSGESRNASLKISRLLYRNSVRKIHVNASIWFRDSKSFLGDAELFPQRRRTGGTELAIDYREFIGNKTIDASLSYRKGTGIFKALSAPEDRFGEGTARPVIIRSNLQFSTPFSLFDKAFQYQASWRRQHNRDPLTPQDRFSIGSRFTVRGFDGENSLSSDRGWLIRNDIVMPFAKEQSLYIGLDYGRVSGASNLLLVGDDLSGAVIGFKGKVAGVSYNIFWGHPLNKPDGFVSDNGVTQFTLTKVF